MLVTVGGTVIVLAVGRKPFYPALDIAMANIALGAHDLHVLKYILLGIELPGDVLGIIVKNNANLLLLTGDDGRAQFSMIFEDRKGDDR